MSSLRLYAPPCCDCASISSLARRCAIVFSRRLRANSTSQRTASVRARRAGTSTGPWEVAPPTRREGASSTRVNGSIGRTPPGARRGTLLGLHAVLRAGLAAVRDAGGVERPADDLVAHAGQVL